MIIGTNRIVWESAVVRNVDRLTQETTFDTLAYNSLALSQGDP